MADALAIREIFSVESAAWTGVCILALLAARMWNGAPAMLDRWLAFRTARAAEKAADWTRLREEIDRLRQQRREDQEQSERRHNEQIRENEKCRGDLAAAVRRIAELEGYLMGQGRAAQEAAGIVAIERAKDRKERGKPE